MSDDRDPIRIPPTKPKKGMAKHKGKPADEPGGELVWNKNAPTEKKVEEFDRYDKQLNDNAKPDTSNPYSRENYYG